MSELSVANTIQQIPIPNNKSDVEAFLDDIFDRALDNSDIKRHQAKAKGLQKRIKEGGTKSNTMQSALENYIFDYILRQRLCQNQTRLELYHTEQRLRILENTKNISQKQTDQLRQMLKAGQRAQNAEILN